MSFLNHYVRNLQTVQRWNIFPTIRTQHVAEHSYYVVLYVIQLVDKFFPHLPAEEKYAIIKAAVKHDAAEARMGDINGPTKREIRDEAKYKALEERVEQQLGFGDWHTSDLARRLIKAADCLDEYFFLTTEVFLGNRMAEGTLSQVRIRLQEALFVALDKSVANVDFVMGHADGQMCQMLNFEAIQNDTDVKPLPSGYYHDAVDAEEIPFD